MKRVQGYGSPVNAVYLLLYRGAAALGCNTLQEQGHEEQGAESENPCRIAPGYLIYNTRVHIS